ncbi:MAG: 16S rRNA (guanine(527)-N(7))-methyltransferase RsmG [Pseudomonadota bacterium]
MGSSDIDHRDRIANSYDVSRETLLALDQFVDFVREQQRTLNIIGPKELDRIWPRHIEDSLQLLPELRDSNHVLDLGSGAGFPGLVLAIALKGRTQITLTESIGKKAAFLSKAIEALELDARVINHRIETLSPFPVQHLTARAFAPLPKLLEYAQSWFEFGAVGLFHKGKSWQEELERAAREWHFRHELSASRTDPSAVILKLSEVRRYG